MNKTKTIQQQKAILGAFWQSQTARTENMTSAEALYQDALNANESHIDKRHQATANALEEIHNFYRQVQDQLRKVNLESSLTTDNVATEESITNPEEQFYNAVNEIKNLHNSIAHAVEDLQRWQQNRAKRNRRLTWAAIIYAVFIVVGWSNFNRQRILNQNYQAGIVALENQQWETARAEFNEVISLDESYKDAQSLLIETSYRLALIALENQEWESARIYLNEVLDLDGHDEDAQELLLESYYQPATIALEKGQWDMAIPALEQMAELDTDYKDTQNLLKASYYTLVTKAIDEGKCGEAKTMAEQLEMIDENYKGFQLDLEAKCGAMTPTAIVGYTFHAYQRGNYAGVYYFMSEKLKADADESFNGNVIDRLDSGYLNAGQLLSETVVKVYQAHGSADINLRTNWSDAGRVCQAYRLEEIAHTSIVGENVSSRWEITSFNTPHKCGSE